MKTGFDRLTLLLLLLTATVLVGLPELSRRLQRPGRNACVNNLRLIDGAKAQWFFKNEKPPGYLPSPAEELEICRHLEGGVRPRCPAGGNYSFNPIEAMPTCSLQDDPKLGPAHALDPSELPKANPPKER